MIEVTTLQLQCLKGERVKKKCKRLFNLTDRDEDKNENMVTEKEKENKRKMKRKRRVK